MKQRLAIAQVLVTKPELILFDEPIAGIDLAGREMFVTAVNELKNKSTIIIASHDLRELGKMCDRAVIIDKGRKIAEDDVKNLGKIFGTVVINITLESPPKEDLGDSVKALGGDINDAKTVGRTLSVMLREKSNESLRKIIDYLCENRIAIETINMSEAKLEDIFTREADAL
jgi:ABC-2 type transport system ATP-binding protein